MLATIKQNVVRDHAGYDCEVADIFRVHGGHYQASYSMPLAHKKVMLAIIRCRTEFQGGHLERCDRCGYERPVYNSCRNRHCPKCQAMAKARWLEARIAELIPVGYFHMVFTLPHEINPVAQCNKRRIYTILFHAVSETLYEFGHNPRNSLGGKMGFILILHTWNQVLLDHYHLHCVIPAGALLADGSRWIAARRHFLFPVRALSRVFRGKFIDCLERSYREGNLSFPGSTAHLAEPSGFKKLIRQIREVEWVVYSKKPFAGPEQVLDYLGRYTHRVAISNHRIIAMHENRVMFRYQDRNDGNTRKIMTVDAVEFIRRFLLHVLPDGFMRIRHYGFLSNRSKKLDLNRIREILGCTSQLSNSANTSIHALMLELTGMDITQCPACRKGTMKQIGDITPRTVALIKPAPNLSSIQNSP
jgi:hypothetical protein